MDVTAGPPDPGSPQEPPHGRGPSVPLRSLLLYVVYLSLGIVGLSLLVVQKRVVPPWTQANVSAAAAVARLILPDARAVGTALSSGPAVLDVRTGCNGVHAVLIFAPAVLAFPAPWTRRLAGLVLGAAAIFALNIVRVVNLLLVAVHLPAQLEFFHIYVWQALMALLAFGIFLLWGVFFAGKG